MNQSSALTFGVSRARNRESADGSEGPQLPWRAGRHKWNHGGGGASLTFAKRSSEN